jgi:DNA-binding response OmpR family regulator
MRNPERMTVNHIVPVIPMMKGPDTPLERTGQGSGPGAAPGTRPLILLVEDEPLVRRTVARMLEAEGYIVVDAEHGQAAHDLLATSGLQPDLVVTDLRRPFLNGAELGHAVSRLRPGVPVLYMSGFGSETSTWISPEALTSCYIAKPFSREQLLDTVRRCLGQSAPN